MRDDDGSKAGARTICPTRRPENANIQAGSGFIPRRLAHKTCPDDLPIRVYADISTFDCGGDPSAREISVHSGKTVASGRAGGVITAKRRVFELREELICSLSKFYAVPKFFGLRFWLS
jgi:hypothetical protein